MTRRRRISAARLEVYRLAVEGNCQKSICQQLEKAKGTISDHIKELIADGYLFGVSGKDQTKFYERGPKAKILDELLKERSSEKKRAGRSRPTINSELRTENSVTPNYSELPLPPSCDVHSHGVRAWVEKVGDMDFLRQSKPGLKGMEQWQGTVMLQDRPYSVRYQESNGDEKWLYVWVQGTFTREELEQNNIEERLMATAQGVFNQVSRKYGWEFGLILESHKGSKTHYVPNSELMDQLAQEIPPDVLATFDDVHFDGTPERDDGQQTPETKSPEAALSLMTDLKEVKDLKIALQVMVDDRQLIIRTLNQAVFNQHALLHLLKSLGFSIPEIGEPKEIKPPTDDYEGVEHG